MAARISGGLVAFGIINIIVALMPPCAGCFGSLSTLGQVQGDARFDLNGRDFGPQFRKHIEREVPGAVPEAFAHAAIASFFSVLLLAGAIGLFLAQQWGRWLTVGASAFLILTFCVHDIYQHALFRPAVMNFIDLNIGPMPPAERAGFKTGFTCTFFMWACSNPVLIIYLFAMSLFLCFTGAFKDVPDEERPRRRSLRDRDYDDDEDDRPRRRSRDDDDDDERPRRRSRDYDDEDEDDDYRGRYRSRR